MKNPVRTVYIYLFLEQKLPLFCRLKRKRNSKKSKCALSTILIVQLLYRERGARTVFKHQVNNDCEEHKNKYMLQIHAFTLSAEHI